MDFTPPTATQLPKLGKTFKFPQMLWQLSFTSKSTLSQITLTHVIAYLVSFLHTDGIRHCILILLHSVVLYRTSVPLSASSLNCVPLLVGLHLCSEIVILPCSLQFLIYVILICCHFFPYFVIILYLVLIYITCLNFVASVLLCLNPCALYV